MQPTKSTKMNVVQIVTEPNVYSFRNRHNDRIPAADTSGTLLCTKYNACTLPNSPNRKQSAFRNAEFRCVYLSAEASSVWTRWGQWISTCSVNSIHITNYFAIAIRFD